jgi:hypothetical protein
MECVKDNIMKTCGKPSRQWLFIALLLCLTGCLNIVGFYLNDCTIIARKKYPDEDKAPQDEPYKSIENCMYDKGYSYDSEMLECRLVYPANVMVAQCYSPRNSILRVWYHIADWVR